MKQKLLEFIRSKLVLVEKSIRAREEGAKVWRTGSAKAWKAVGCRKTKSQRIALADSEERILIKLLHEKEMLLEINKLITDLPQ